MHTKAFMVQYKKIVFNVFGPRKSVIIVSECFVVKLQSNRSKK